MLNDSKLSKKFSNLLKTVKIGDIFFKGMYLRYLKGIGGAGKNPDIYFKIGL